MEFCKVVLTFESVDETLWCDHSNESSLPVLTHGATCFSRFHKMKFGIFCWILPLATFGSDRVKNRTMWCVDTNLYCHECSIFIKLEFACLQIFIELLQKWKILHEQKNLRMKKIQPLWHYTATKIKCHCSDSNYLRWDSWQATPNMSLVLIQMLLLKNS